MGLRKEQYVGVRTFLLCVLSQVLWCASVSMSLNQGNMTCAQFRATQLCIVQAGIGLK